MNDIEFCGRPVYNVTPHDICVANEKNEIILRIKKTCEEPLRLVETTTTLREFQALKIVSHGYVAFNYEFKPPRENALIITSPVIVDFLQNHKSSVCNPYQYIAPDTGPDSAVRDDNGNIIAVKRFLGVC
jgi:hypothetical protein